MIGTMCPRAVLQLKCQANGFSLESKQSSTSAVALINAALRGPLSASPPPIFPCHRAAAVPCITSPSLAATESARGKVISFVSLPLLPLSTPLWCSVYQPVDQQTCRQYNPKVDLVLVKRCLNKHIHI